MLGVTHVWPKRISSPPFVLRIVESLVGALGCDSDAAIILHAYLEAVDQAHLEMTDTVAGSLRSCRWGDTPSMKRHGHPFPVTGGALKGACFLPILGWCRHDESHFLRALGTK
jgi:hypothetical protein